VIKPMSWACIALLELMSDAASVGDHDTLTSNHCRLATRGPTDKPSDGLEPSTRSLPSSGHGKAFATTFSLQIRPSGRVCRARACPDGPDLLYPSGTRGSLTLLTTNNKELVLALPCASGDVLDDLDEFFEAVAVPPRSGVPTTVMPCHGETRTGPRRGVAGARAAPSEGGGHRYACTGNVDRLFAESFSSGTLLRRASVAPASCPRVALPRGVSRHPE